MENNLVLEQLYERKSHRAFLDAAIAKEDKEKILMAAAMAPTAGNQQLYTILDITKQSLKEKLSVTCDNQPFIAEAKMVLIFLADCRKWYEAYLAVGESPRKPGAGDLLLAVSDANIAAQNAVIASESLGIGSCYIGDIMENCEEVKELLQLPEYVFPAAMLVFGYPTEQQKERIKPNRFPLSYIVRENSYGNITAEETIEALKLRAYPAVSDIKTWLSAFCKRKYNSDFAKEMSRSVAEYLKEYDIF